MSLKSPNNAKKEKSNAKIRRSKISNLTLEDLNHLIKIYIQDFGINPFCGFLFALNTPFSCCT